MKLEEIVRLYGWNDYYDMHTGYIYHLSRSFKSGGSILVPVSSNGNMFGYAHMDEIDEVEIDR